MGLPQFFLTEGGCHRLLDGSSRCLIDHGRLVNGTQSTIKPSFVSVLVGLKQPIRTLARVTALATTTMNKLPPHAELSVVVPARLIYNRHLTRNTTALESTTFGKIKCQHVMNCRSGRKIVVVKTVIHYIYSPLTVLQRRY